MSTNKPLLNTTYILASFAAITAFFVTFQVISATFVTIPEAYVLILTVFITGAIISFIIFISLISSITKSIHKSIIKYRTILTISALVLLAFFIFMTFAELNRGAFAIGQTSKFIYLGESYNYSNSITIQPTISDGNIFGGAYYSRVYNEGNAVYTNISDYLFVFPISFFIQPSANLMYIDLSYSNSPYYLITHIKTLSITLSGPYGLLYNETYHSGKIPVLNITNLQAGLYFLNLDITFSKNTLLYSSTSNNGFTTLYKLNANLYPGNSNVYQYTLGLVNFTS